VEDTQELAGQLLIGNWFVVRHENAGPNCDLEYWKKCLGAWCDEVGVSVDFIDIPEKDVTLAYNVAAMPTFDQARQTVERALHERWMARV
jgi:hypothetical protein